MPALAKLFLLINLYSSYYFIINRRDTSLLLWIFSFIYEVVFEGFLLFFSKTARRDRGATLQIKSVRMDPRY